MPVFASLASVSKPFYHRVARQGDRARFVSPSRRGSLRHLLAAALLCGLSCLATTRLAAAPGARRTGAVSLENGTVPQATAVNLQAASYDLIGDLLTQTTSGTAAAPVIVAAPVGLLSQIGATVSFSVNATGTPGLTYQWRFNGVNIPAAANASATTDTLLLPNLTTGSFGNYSVAVSNVDSTVVSANAALQLDSVGDGIPDSWKAQYFGANWASNASSAANADPDGDGLTNLQEYQDGTSPVSAASHYYTLTVAGGNAVAVTPAGTRFAPGTVVTLTAPPVAASQFLGWSGDVPTTVNPLTLTMNRNFRVAPVYGALPLDNTVPSFSSTDGTAVQALAVLGSGQVVVGGSFQAVNGLAHYALARLNADGTLDSAFGPTVTLGTQGIGAAVAAIPGTVSAIAAQTDGKILIAGGFNYVDNAQYSPYITRLNTDGSVDTSFQAVVPTYANIAQMFVNASGTVLVNTGAKVLELNGNGSVNTAFSSALPGSTTITRIVWQTDGKVIYNGYASDGSEVFGRLTSTGALDPSYTPAVIPGSDDALALRPNNELYIASVGNLGPDQDNPVAVVLLTTSGAVDPAFHAPTTIQLLNPSAIAVLPDGGCVVNGGVGYTPANGNYTQEGLARFAASGSFAAGYFPNLEPDAQYTTLAVDSTGALLVGGTFNTLETASNLNLGRLSLSNGTVDAAYSAPITSLSSVGGIAATPDGQAIVWGGFNVANGRYYRPYVARLAAPGYVDLSFNAGSGPDAPVLSAVIQTNGAVVIGGRFSTVNGQPSTGRVARFAADGSLDTGFAVAGSGFDDAVETLALQTDGRIVVGGDFLTVNGVAHLRLARLTSTGAVDTAFNPTTNDRVETVLVQPDGKILVGGAFTMIDGVAVGGLARLNADGSLDTSFNPANLGNLLSNVVQCLALQPNGQILAGGRFTTNILNTVLPGAGLIRLNADGTPDYAFNNAFAGVLNLSNGVYLQSLAVQPDGRIVATGNFSVNGSGTAANVIRLNATGTVDPTCFAFGAPDRQVNAVALLANGGMMLGGNFAAIGGTNRLAYVRLVTTNHIQPGALSVTVNSGSVGFSLSPQSTGSAVVNVAVEQSTDGAATFQLVGYATAGSNGTWTYTGPAVPAGLVYYRATVADAFAEQASTNAVGPFAGPLSITSPLSVVAYVGLPFSYVATASAVPTGFTARGLPTWASASFNTATGAVTISGTPTAEGIVAVTLRANNAMTVTSAALTITVYNRFAAWQAANFTPAQLQTPAVSGPLGDATGAGILNLTKYALGIPPLRPGVAGLPAVGTVSEAGQKYLTLTYTQDLLATDVTVSVEASGDLRTWNSGVGYTSQLSATNNGDGTQTVVVRDDAAYSTHARRFLRLRIIQNASP